MDGILYKTVEHYYHVYFISYQACKFPGDGKGKEIRDEIVKAETPLETKKLARKYETEFGDKAYWKDWHERKKLDVMRDGVRAKFEQNPELAKRLLETGDKYLIEDSPKDYYWGGALPGSVNMLGNLLMEQRYFLRKNSKK